MLILKQPLELFFMKPWWQCFLETILTVLWDTAEYTFIETSSVSLMVKLYRQASNLYDLYLFGKKLELQNNEMRL